MLVQTAQIARQDIRQHRHNAVREIGRVAPLARLAVQGAARGHIMADIGNGDPQDMAAGVARVGVRGSSDRIVTVTGIDRVDGDQRHIPQILALTQRSRDGAVRFGNHGIGELIRDAVLVNGDQRHRPRARRIAQPRRDPGLRQADHALADQLALDQLAVLGAAGEVARHPPFLVAALVDGQNPSAAIFRIGRIGAEYPQHFQRVHTQRPDQPRLIIVILPADLGQPRQNAVARTQRRIALARHDQNAGAGIHTLLQGPRHQVAVAVRPDHLQHGHRRQGTRLVIGLGALFDHALLLQFAQDAFQVDAGIARDPKGLGDVALGRKAGVLGDPLADLVFGGKGFHGP